MPTVPQTIQMSGAGVDLSPRFSGNNTVVASPATTLETVVATLGPFTSNVAVGSGVLLLAQAAFPVGSHSQDAPHNAQQCPKQASVAQVSETR